MAKVKPKEALLGTLFNDRYKLTDLLSTGGNGAVYSAFDTVEQKNVAVKIGDKRTSVLGWEWCVHMHLVASGRPPIFHDFIRLPKFSALVMDLYSGSLFDQMLEIEDVRKCMLPVLEQLRCLHACGYVHRDIKPANILWKTTFDNSQEFDPSSVLLTDFGACERYLKHCAEGPRHIKMTEGQPFSGTQYFASRRQLRGISCSRMDDMESLGYTVMALMHISIPGWKTVRRDEMARCRDEFFETLDDISDLPEFLKLYFGRLKNQPFDACPLYTI
jgi:serine/threonine protein kinase